jgi:hypothetical protein
LILFRISSFGFRILLLPAQGLCSAEVGVGEGIEGGAVSCSGDSEADFAVDLGVAPFRLAAAAVI